MHFLQSEHTKNILFVILFVLLSLCPASLYYATNTDTPRADALENVMNGYSFYKDGVFVIKSKSAEEIKVSNRREPLYPLFLSWMFRLSPSEAFKTHQFKCFETKDLCPDFIRTTKKINWFFHAMTVLFAGFFILMLTNRRSLALGAMTLLSFNLAMMTGANSWLTEPQATFFLLVHSVCLYGMFYRPRKMLHALFAGLSLGLLILTKNLFIYLLYLYVPVIAFLLIRRVNVKAILLVTFAVLAVLAPWAARNYVHTSAIDVAQSDRGGQVLAIRAEYDTMPWSEIPLLFLYFTPGGEDPVKYYDKNVYDHFDRENNDGYYARVKNEKGAAYERAKEKNISLESAALQVIAQNGLKHLALTPVFAWGGLFIPDKISFIDDKPFIAKPLTLIASFFALILTVVSAVYLLRRREFTYLLLFIPGVFSFGFCSFLTHNWPRYSVPLLAIALVCIAVTWHIRSQRRAPNG